MQEKIKSVYDDGNIPEVDLPQNCHKEKQNPNYEEEPLPETERPRKDGPGGD